MNFAHPRSTPYLLALLAFIACDANVAEGTPGPSTGNPTTSGSQDEGSSPTSGTGETGSPTSTMDGDPETTDDTDSLGNTEGGNTNSGTSSMETDDSTTGSSETTGSSAEDDDSTSGETGTSTSGSTGESTGSTGDETTTGGPVDCSVPRPGFDGPAWINEFHYDNASGDVNEFIEVAAISGTDLSDWHVITINGSDNQIDQTLSLPQTPASSDGLDYYVVVAPSNIQNENEGILLVDDDDDVVEFISYETEFNPITITFDGVEITSIDIGVEESFSTPPNGSLGLLDNDPQAGCWVVFDTATRGSAN